ncbi:MAG TPA: hypothetical protein VK928_13570, partial [Longimicrobiales bacterium]|nr:hypothetical protein [Longimicrobiales bacterium]
VEPSFGGSGVLAIEWEATDSSAVLTGQHSGTPATDEAPALEVDGGLVPIFERHPNGTLRYIVETAAAPSAPVTIRPPAIAGTAFRPVVGIEPLVLLAPDTLRITGVGGDIAYTGVTPRTGGAGVTVDGFTVSRVTTNARVQVYSEGGQSVLTILASAVNGPVHIPTALLPAFVSRGTITVRLSVSQVSETPMRDYALHVVRLTYAQVPFVVVDR